MQARRGTVVEVASAQQSGWLFADGHMTAYRLDDVDATSAPLHLDTVVAFAVASDGCAVAVRAIALAELLDDGGRGGSGDAG